MEQTKKYMVQQIQLCIWTLSQLASQASQTIIVNSGGDLNIDTIDKWYGL